MENVEQTAMVLLIHGTAAGDPSDSGERWWQQDSDFGRDLEQRLGIAGALSHGKVFHWGSGPNSERQRRQAGERLYRWLQTIDATGQPYHVIGHSHGGSVLWHALIESARSKRGLLNLRSWSTIGTPFLHFHATPAVFWQAFVFMITCYATVLSARTMQDLAAHWTAMAQDEQRGVALVIGCALLALLIGLLTALILCGRSCFATIEHARRARLCAEAWTQYGAIWTGISSPEDEAINGLRSSLGLRGPIVPRATAWGTSWMARVASVATFPLRAVYNVAFAPPADQLVWNLVSRGVQGNDLAAAQMVDVTRAPVSWAVLEDLPESVVGELAMRANQAAAQTLSAIRTGLSANAMRPDLPSFLGKARSSLSWTELIHNGYFHLPSVRARLAEAIVDGSSLPTDRRVSAPPAATAEAAPYRTRWMTSGGRVTAAAITVVTLLSFATARALDNSVLATYRDEYQLRTALAEAPLDDAIKEMEVGSSLAEESVVVPWIRALVAGAHWDMALSVGRRIDMATGQLISELLQHGRADLVADLLRDIRKDHTNRSPNCQLAKAVAILLRADRPDLAMDLADSLDLRDRPAYLQGGGCAAEFFGVNNSAVVKSSDDAVDFVRSLKAVVLARRGASASDTLAVLELIAADRQTAAIDEVIAQFLNDGRPLDAYRLLEFAVTVGHSQKLSLTPIFSSLTMHGHREQAIGLAKKAIGLIAKDDEFGIRAWSSALASVGLVKEAIQLVDRSEFASSELAMLVPSIVRAGDLVRAEALLSRVPREQRRTTLEEMVVAAMETQRPGKAEEYGREIGADPESEAPILLARGGQVEAALRLARLQRRPYEHLSQLSSALEEPGQRSLAGGALLAALSNANLPDRIKYLPVVLRTVQTSGERKLVAVRLARDIADGIGGWTTPIDADQFHNAIKALVSLIETGYLDEAIVAHAAFAAHGQFRESLPPERFALPERLASVGQIQAALLVCQTAGTVECPVGKHLPLQAGGLEAMAAELVKGGQAAEAAVLAARANDTRKMTQLLEQLNKPDQAGAAASVLSALASAGWSEPARAATTFIGSEMRAELLPQLFRSSLDKGDAQGALDAARAMTDPIQRATHLHKATKLVSLDDSRAVAALREALALASSFPEIDRPRFRSEVAVAMIERRAFREGRLICSMCWADGKMKAYTALVERCGTSCGAR